METAHDHLQGQPLQDGLMDIEFAWDVPETPLPPGPVPGSKCVSPRYFTPQRSILLVLITDANWRNVSMVANPIPILGDVAEVGGGVDTAGNTMIVRETAAGNVSADGHVVPVVTETETVTGPEGGVGSTTTKVVVVDQGMCPHPGTVGITAAVVAVDMVLPALTQLLRSVEYSTSHVMY